MLIYEGTKDKFLMSVEQDLIAIEIENNIVHISYNTKEDNLSRLIDYVRENNVSYTSLFSERPTLNDVFLELTGKELRD